MQSLYYFMVLDPVMRHISRRRDWKLKESGMRRSSSLALLIMLFTHPSQAQQPQVPFHVMTPPIDAVQACFQQAIELGHIRKQQSYISFTCTGNTAEGFYDLLHGHATAEAMLGSYKAQQRHLDDEDNDSDKCNHLYEDANGSSINRFQCTLFYQAGSFLNE